MRIFFFPCPGWGGGGKEGWKERKRESEEGGEEEEEGIFFCLSLAYKGGWGHNHLILYAECVAYVGPSVNAFQGMSRATYSMHTFVNITDIMCVDTFSHIAVNI